MIEFNSAPCHKKARHAVASKVALRTLPSEWKYTREKKEFNAVLLGISESYALIPGEPTPIQEIIEDTKSMIQRISEKETLTIALDFIKSTENQRFLVFRIRTFLEDIKGFRSWITEDRCLKVERISR